MLELIAAVMSITGVVMLFRGETRLSLACSTLSLYCRGLMARWQRSRGE